MKSFLVFLLLFFTVFQIQGKDIKIVKSYNWGVDRITFGCTDPDKGIRDTLRIDDQVILLQKSPLLLLTDTIDTYLFPEYITAAGSTAHGYPSCARGFIASWVLKDGKLYLEKIDPCPGARLVDLGVLSKNEEDETLIQKRGILALVTPEGHVRGLKYMERVDFAPDRVIRKRIEKLTGAKFKKGLLRASWVNDTIVGMGDFHFRNGEQYKEEYYFPFKDGKFKECKAVAIKKREFDNKENLEAYLSKEVDWNTGQESDILMLEFNITEKGQVDGFFEGDFRPGFNRSLAQTQNIRTDFLESFKKALSRLPERSFSTYFLPCGYHFPRCSYIVIIDSENKRIKLIEQDQSNKNQ